MKILHIIATPRLEESRTLKVTETFLKTLKQKHPDYQIDELNLFKEQLPDITAKNVDGKLLLLGGGNLDADLKSAWRDIEKHIERFLNSDLYLISTPMWNFNIPYVLKHYIDIIVQPKYTFHYTANGPQGLLKNKKLVVIASRGGDYSPGTPSEQFDLQEPYLRKIFGLIGLTDISFIVAQPMDAMGIEVQFKKIKQAQEEASSVALSI